MKLSESSKEFQGDIQWIQCLQSQRSFEDTMIVCGDGSELLVSKVLLAAVSPYLRTCLSCATDLDDIEAKIICDTSREIVEKFLELVKSGQTSFCTKDVCDDVKNFASSIKFDFNFDCTDGTLFKTEPLVPDPGKILDTPEHYGVDEEIYKGLAEYDTQHTLKLDLEIGDNEKQAETDTFADLSKFLDDQEKLPEDSDQENGITSAFENKRKSRKKKNTAKSKRTRTLKKGSLPKRVNNYCDHTHEDDYDQCDKNHYQSCKECGKEFRGRFAIHIHMAEHFGKEALNCKYCSQPLTNMSKWLKHLKYQDCQNVICDLCGKEVKKASLPSHLKTMHTDQNETFTCPICGKVITSKGNLKHHMVTHTKERPHICEVCGKSFKTQYSLQEHNLKLHDPEGRQFQCPKCDKRYTSKGLLNHHMKTHGERMFRCNICDKTFAQKGILTAHMNTHGDPRVECKVCGMKFVDPKSFPYHAVLHSDIHPFGCEECNSSFKHRETLRRHYLKEHPNIKPRVKSALGSIAQELTSKYMITL